MYSYKHSVATTTAANTATTAVLTLVSSRDVHTVCCAVLLCYTTQQRVKVVFQRCGRIESVRIRAEKGFGFVTFLTEKVISTYIVLYYQ
jgi:RNA recognition motif. (a.k.a. RRM, RBD, or RNP domain)